MNYAMCSSKSREQPFPAPFSLISPSLLKITSTSNASYALLMSYTFGSEPATTHEHDSHQSFHDAEGQRHDRIPIQKQDTSTMAGSNAPDITITQRMISATVGSVLTSLLGTYLGHICESSLTQDSHASGCCPRTITISRHSCPSCHQQFAVSRV
jgi:hypothetical protein